MSSRKRALEFRHLYNLARKARRRGDAAETARWSHAINQRFLAERRIDQGVLTRFRFERDMADLERDRFDLKREQQEFEEMKEELVRLRRYCNWHPHEIERAKAAETAGFFKAMDEAGVARLVQEAVRRVQAAKSAGDA
jgi:hypothetical protein